jgi:hypothetical protein
MQTSSELKPPNSTQALAFLFYLIGGISIFFFGANTFRLFPTNKNLVYEWGLTAIFLFLAILMQRKPSLQGFSRISSALFIASAANAVNLSLGNFLGEFFNKTSDDMLSLSLDKLSQAVPIILTIILFTLWRGDSLGELFLKKGNLRQGLRFGLIHSQYSHHFMLSLVQANAGPGLFGTGVM